MSERMPFPKNPTSPEEILQKLKEQTERKEEMMRDPERFVSKDSLEEGGRLREIERRRLREIERRERIFSIDKVAHDLAEGEPGRKGKEWPKL